MTDWGFLSELFGSLQAHSPMLGRVWLLLMLVFRMLILGTVASDMFDDEQEEFTCNTLQPGCKQVCYDDAFPVSQYRFWVFHIVLISTPALVFFMYAMHHHKKHQVLLQDSTTNILEAKQNLHLKRLYIVNVTIRMMSEVAFLIGQWKLYGFRVEPRFPCSRFPCPYTVDCFTSRPMEKTVFLLFYFVIGILSAVSSLAEIIHVIFKWFMKSSDGTEREELESENKHLSPSEGNPGGTRDTVQSHGKTKRTGTPRTNSDSRETSIRCLEEIQGRKSAELIV